MRNPLEKLSGPWYRAGNPQERCRMFGQLLPCGGGDVIPLLKTRLVVGRTGDCDVTLPLGTISSKHCLLEQRQGVWYVSDLASRNGIRVDGVRCQEGKLVPGSVLWIATQRFQVEYSLPTSAANLTPPARSSAARDSASARPDLKRDTTVIEPPPQLRTPAAAPPPKAPSVKPGVALGELIPCGGGSPIPLLKHSLLVGRAPSCDISLPFPMVSSKHCQLEFKGGYWHVRDLGSTNGIRVDGIVQLAKYLRPGEVLSIAKHRFEISYTPLTDEPPPEENPFALSLMEKAGLVRRGSPVRESRLPAERDEEPTRKRWSIDDTG
jgi:adenylate cyclase